MSSLSRMLAVVAAGLAAWTPPAPAQSAAPLAARRFEVRPAAGEIRVDGVLDDAGWVRGRRGRADRGALGDHQQRRPPRRASIPTSRRSRPTPRSSTSTSASPSSSRRSARSSSRAPTPSRRPFARVFTRTVADPELGVKLSTGKEGGNAFGVFVACAPTAVELKLGRHVNAQLAHTLQRLEVPGGELFEANLSQLRLVYNFNVRALARAILQYTDITRDPALFPFAVEAETERLFTQLLLSYKLNAKTVFFLGYSDNSLGGVDLSLTRTDRTVFAKIGYAFLL
jgi:hypothetical protein